jgi:hypothetical protein
MWEPRHLTTLWASTACYRVIFTLLYTVEMGSGAMIYIPSFIKICSGIQKLIRGERGDSQTAWRSHKPTFIYLFSKYGKLAEKISFLFLETAKMISFFREDILNIEFHCQ